MALQVVATVNLNVVIKGMLRFKPCKELLALTALFATKSIDAIGLPTDFGRCVMTACLVT